MTEQPGETNCTHGIGHKADLHGCDGCCSIDNQKAEIIDNEFEFRRGYHYGLTEEQERIIKIIDAYGNPGYAEAWRPYIEEACNCLVVLIKKENQ